MSLTTIKTALDKLASDGALTFSSLAQQAASASAVLGELPPIGDVGLAGAKTTLAGQGDAQTLTVTATVDWELLKSVGVTIVITPDPSAADKTLCAVTLAPPASATLSIPGLDWFGVNAFSIHGKNLPWSIASSDLSPGIDLSLAATLLIKGDHSQTPIPILIESDPTGQLLVSLNAAAIDLPSINDILAAFGPGASDIRLPDTLNDLLHFTLKDLSVGFDPQAKEVSQIAVAIAYSAANPGGWPIIPNALSLRGYTIYVVVAHPLSARQVSGIITAQALLGKVEIDISAQRPASGGWLFEGALGEGTSVSIKDVADGLNQQFKVAVPDLLRQLALTDFKLSFDTATYDVSGGFSLTFLLNSTTILLTVAAALTRAGDAYNIHVTGDFAIGAAHFIVAFDSAPGSQRFQASLRGEDGGAEPVSDLLQSLLGGGVDIGLPSSLKVTKCALDARLEGGKVAAFSADVGMSGGFGLLANFDLEEIDVSVAYSG